MDFQSIISHQNVFFASQQTKAVAYRIEQLKLLEQVLRKNESLLYEAIYADFKKSEFDTYLTELAMLYADISYFIKNVTHLAKPKRVKTNLPNLPGSSKVYAEPLGTCLVIGAWNYPLLLSLSPAIAAIAAGNTVVLKPSEVAGKTSQVLAQLINNHFSPAFFYVVEGGVVETTALLQLKFDKIFYTGSTEVGKIVYQAAAKQLIPVTLELGGKSPVIVSKYSNLELAAKRIVWGKFLNAGQTCVAPDYVLVHEDVKEQFIELLKTQISKNNYEASSTHYTQIINEKHFNRLTQLIQAEKVVFGGGHQIDQLFIEPTLMDDVSWEDAVMQAEIFGPILPILTFKRLDEVLQQVETKEKPLAAYLFSTNKEEQQMFTNQFSFGGGCINDVVMQLSNPSLPFGGVGASGFGSYHGKYGFDTFSHKKSVLKKATWGEPNLKYPPYTIKKQSWLKILLRFLD